MNDLKKDHDLMLDMAGSGEIKKKSSSPESGRQSPPGSSPAQVILFLIFQFQEDISENQIRLDPGRVRAMRAEHFRCDTLLANFLGNGTGGNW